MGSPRCQFGRGLYNEEELEVTLTRDFEIQETEVTRGAWVAAGFTALSEQHSACVAPECPAGWVSWQDGVVFANRMSETHEPPLPACYRLLQCTGAPGVDLMCGRVELTFATPYDCPGYRLPTDAEWEYAARAGTRTAFYLGPNINDRYSKDCDEEPFLAPAAWYCFNGIPGPHPVGLRVPNGWGLLDMLGNVREWTSDDYTSRRVHDGVMTVTDPGATLPDTTGEATKRGGDAATGASGTMVSGRLPQKVTSRLPLVGFRLARTLSSQDAGR